jgi:hypothetical protein
MLRDSNLIRTILLAIEAADDAELLTMPRIPGHDRAEVHFHVRLLVEAGLAHAVAETRYRGRDWLALRLSWQGYDYLDSIRDPAVWRLVQRVAKRTGSWSIETLGAIAKATVIAKAQSLGLPMSI